MRLPVERSTMLAGWSLANIVFLEQWQTLLAVDSSSVSFFVTRLTVANYLALIANVIVFGTLGASIASIARKTINPITRWICILCVALGCAYALNAIRRGFLASGLVTTIGPGARSGGAIILGVILLAVTLGLLRYRGGRSILDLTGRVVGGAGLVLAPFLVYTFGKSIHIAATSGLEEKFAPEPLASRSPRSPEINGRVLVIIFDEADYRLMFAERPHGVDMPNFDRLRSESLFATQALPPAEHTELSIPSYLIGRTVVSATPANSRDIELELQDDPGKRHLMSDLLLLFAEAQSAGARVGVVGWSQPYCRLAHQKLSECYARSSLTPPTTLLRAMLWQLGEAVSVGPFLDRAYGIGLPYHSLSYLDLMKHAQGIVASPELDLIWIHLPVPHEPRIYDRRRKIFVGPELHNRDAYPDNLALADIALGQLRTEAERAGKWNGSNVIVTSDHPYRLSARDDGKSDPRVPFMVKLAGAPIAGEIVQPFNTIALRAMTLDMLRSNSVSRETVMNRVVESATAGIN